MKHLYEYRDPRAAGRLVDAINGESSRRWVLMEVCGGQTHSILRHGIATELRDSVELIHGPGCPVCVTPQSDIDFACRLAEQPQTTLCSFGDMLRVPGTSESLQQIRGRGGNVRPVYSPLDAVDFAQTNPQQEVVFFAVGFETTAPATAAALLQAEQLELANFSLIVSHVRVQPAMEAIVNSPENRVQAFLAAGHVCTVDGFSSYQTICDQWHLPVVVTGFEPVDLLQGILACVRQLESQRHELENSYQRCVDLDGNPAARSIVEKVYRVSDREWRGFGTIPSGGLALRPEWKRFDACERFGEFNTVNLPVIETEACQSPDVLAGRILPTDCDEFGKGCTPDHPLGAPMVSSEGACAAYARFSRTQTS